MRTRWLAMAAAALAVALSCAISLAGCGAQGVFAGLESASWGQDTAGAAATLEWDAGGQAATVEVEQGEAYYDLEHVLAYLYLFDELPENYVTKAEAREAGWEGGSVDRYIEGAAIGGDAFGNREGILPNVSGRTYRECDIDTDGAQSRGAKRLIYSSDGHYYYTSDHYESFTEYVVADGTARKAT